MALARSGFQLEQERDHGRDTKDRSRDAAVREIIEIAQAHRSWAKWTNKQAGVRNWLISESRKVRPARPQRGGEPQASGDNGYTPPTAAWFRENIAKLTKAMKSADEIERQVITEEIEADRVRLARMEAAGG